MQYSITLRPEVYALATRDAQALQVTHSRYIQILVEQRLKIFPPIKAPAPLEREEFDVNNPQGPDTDELEAAGKARGVQWVCRLSDSLSSYLSQDADNNSLTIQQYFRDLIHTRLRMWKNPKGFDFYMQLPQDDDRQGSELYVPPPDIPPPPEFPYDLVYVDEIYQQAQKLWLESQAKLLREEGRGVLIVLPHSLVEALESESRRLRSPLPELIRTALIQRYLE